MPEPARFVWPARVYWEDTDAGGVVYHASYLRFMERARTEWLRARGVDQGALRATRGAVLLVRDMQIDFFAPAVLDDLLEVDVRLERARAASLVLAQSITRRDRPEAVLVQARVRIACVDPARMRPVPMPAELAAAIGLH